MKRVNSFPLAMALGLLVARASAGGEGERTLSRSEDPVVVIAEQLGPVQGEAISGLALLRWQGGKFEPIPWQVDERNPAGKFCLEQGPKANAKECNGLLDGKDELSFMAADAGARAPEGASKPAGAGKSAELEISDPVAGGKGWAYLMVFAANPPRSPVDYVKHEIKQGYDWVLAENYEFAEQVGASYFDRLLMKNADGKMSVNLVDQLNGGVDVKLMHGLVSTVIRGRNTRADLIAWTDGPVRVIHRMHGYMKEGPIKIGGSGDADDVFYRNYFYTPIYINLPFNPATVFTDFRMNYMIDWNGASDGLNYFDTVNTKGVRLDGKMEAAEKGLNTKSALTYWAVSGPQGSLLVRLTAPEKWSKVVTLQAYYVDDDTAKVKNIPDNVPGERQTGFEIAGIKNIDKGTHLYTFYYFLPARAIGADNIGPILNILDHPLQVKALGVRL